MENVKGKQTYENINELLFIVLSMKLVKSSEFNLFLHVKNCLSDVLC
jgi:hypothetical protein